MGWLDGRVALVVGGGSGIGRGVVDAFRAEGAEVAVLDVSAEKIEELASLGVTAVRGDATLTADAQRAVEATVDAHGRLDTLVCCPAIWDYFVSLRDMPADKLSEAFEELFAINVKSSLVTVKAASDQLLAHSGSVTLTLSNAAFGPAGGGPLYTASKFAIRGLVEQLAYELPRCGSTASRRAGPRQICAV